MLLEKKNKKKIIHFKNLSVTVVIDHNRDPSAPTGTFEIVYEENIEEIVNDTRTIDASSRKQSIDMSWIKTFY